MERAGSAARWYVAVTYAEFCRPLIEGETPLSPEMAALLSQAHDIGVAEGRQLEQEFTPPEFVLRHVVTIRRPLEMPEEAGRAALFNELQPTIPERLRLFTERMLERAGIDKATVEVRLASFPWRGRK